MGTNLPNIVLVRCCRCDKPSNGESHRCGHGARCVVFTRPDCCQKCNAFKARQIALFPEDNTPAKPFVKWAGGKRQLVPQLLRHLPESFGRYHEPFVGGGAMFFALGLQQPQRVALNDSNERLMRTYRAIASNVETVIDLLSGYPLDRDFFLILRSQPIDSATDAEVAAWMIYLNHTAFNGLYRVNKKGDFNAPWGKYKNPKICDADNLRRCAQRLRGVTLSSGDFELAALDAKPGDLVYFDPPYIPVDKGSFTGYTGPGFGPKDHTRLARLAAKLKDSGVHVMLTNSDTEMTRYLYADDFTIYELDAKGSIAASASSRGKHTELLVC